MLSRKLRFLKCNAPSDSKAGFTLIELMLVVALLAIMTGIAIPGIISWLPNYRLKASAGALYSNMQKAKLEAIKRNDTIQMTITAVGVGAPPACPPGGGGGYVFFIDDGSGGGVPDDNIRNGTELRIANVTLQQGVCVVAHNLPLNSGFGPRGLAAGALGITRIITMGHTDIGRQIQVRQFPSGGLRVSD